MKSPGTYELEILQGCGKGHGGSKIEISLAGQKQQLTIEDTGHFQNFVPRDAGTFEIKSPGTYRVEIRALSKAKVAVCDIRMMVLKPVGRKR